VTRLAAVATALPAHYYAQEQLLEALRRLWAERYYNPERLEAFHRNLQIGGRHLALPKERYPLPGFGAANQAFLEVALELGQTVLERLFQASGVAAQDIAQLAFTTVTGLAVPSVEARLMNRLPFAPDLKRLPLFGLGCVAGAAGVARVHDYLLGHPGEAAVLLAVELCSLTLQPQDLSVPNLISTGLFGDGAAAVLLVGSDHPLPGPSILASRSRFFPDSERVMGWEIDERGFTIVLGPEVAEFARGPLVQFIEEFLAEHGLRATDIAAWVAHPGGPKVIEALESRLGIDLERSRRSLSEVGNLSSASVLFILEETLRQPPPPGSYGLMLAMGPAFCAELVLLRWP